MSCDHIERKRVLITHKDPWGDSDDWDEWVTEERSLEEDLDLHRTKCTKCGHIGYYSGAARRVYEGGATQDDYDRIGGAR